jgi:two-component system, NarL family, sensor histidine kinase UhpB
LTASGPAEIRELVAVFNDMLDRLEGERRESGRRALAAQEAERKRIARELHDEVGQSLTAVVLLLKRLADVAPDELQSHVLEAQEAARESVDDLRDVARQLRPEALDDLGLASALTALAARFSEQTGIPVTRMVSPSLPELENDAELVVYRIAQESLTNVARHAHASHVELRLERAPRGVVLRVVDDGVGIESWNGAGQGLRGMQERALAVGAALSVARARHGGVEVILELPVDRTP